MSERLTDFLHDRYNDEADDLQAACGCALPDTPLEHGARCPVLRLADLEAKRRVIFDLIDRHDWAGVSQGTAEHLARLLAAPYADRADFDPAWGQQ